MEFVPVLVATVAVFHQDLTGTIVLDDLDVLREKDEVRKLLGYLPPEFGLYTKVTA